MYIISTIFFRNIDFNFSFIEEMCSSSKCLVKKGIIHLKARFNNIRKTPDQKRMVTLIIQANMSHEWQWLRKAYDSGGRELFDFITLAQNSRGVKMHEN